jgi:hypothetical protein
VAGIHTRPLNLHSSPAKPRAIISFISSIKIGHGSSRFNTPKAFAMLRGSTILAYFKLNQFSEKSGFKPDVSRDNSADAPSFRGLRANASEFSGFKQKANTGKPSDTKRRKHSGICRRFKKCPTLLYSSSRRLADRHPGC